MRTYYGTIGLGRTLGIGFLAAVLALLLVAAPTLQGQTTEPAPAPTPAAVPAVSAPTPPAPTSAPAAPAPVVPAPAPEAPALPTLPQTTASEFSDQETILLSTVSDNNADLVTTALSVLLKHAAMLPDNIKAEKVELNALLVAPQKFRDKLKPLAIEGWYAGLEAKEAVAKEWWPAGTFYLMHVAMTTGKDAPIVLVALTKLPPSSLLRGTKVYFTGYFYKNALLPLQLNETEKRVNPVLVAKAVEVGAPDEYATQSHFNTWGLVAAIVTLLGLGIYFQMRVKTHKQQAAMQQRVHAVTHQPEEDADFDIDPALQQEVERFEAEQEAAHHPKDPQ